MFYLLAYLLFYKNLQQTVVMSSTNSRNLLDILRHFIHHLNKF